MGNTESMSESQHEFYYQHPPNYDGSSVSNSYHQPSSYTGSLDSTTYDQPSAYTGNLGNTNHHQPSSHATSSVNTRHHHNKQPTYIADNFSSLDQVVSALREAGLESSNLILGIDFTKSNEWTGKYSFHRKSLHHIGSAPNPYEQAISIIGRTLSTFDEDNLIPCFGFGDASTHDQNVFSFYPDNRVCHGFEEVLTRYRQIVPHLKLSGPTSFAPVIDAAIDIVERNNGQYHVLVIIADGQVTRNPGTPHGKLSPQEQATITSIIAASHYPLSIILVGVGDGPWDEMKHFDDNITGRVFDNFQFVNFTKIMSENTEASKKETEFALAALMEIPFQYRAAQNIQLANEPVHYQHKRPLPPPKEIIDHDNAFIATPRITNFDSIEPTAPASAEPVCPICSKLKPGFLNSLSDRHKVELLQFHTLSSFISISNFDTLTNPVQTQAGDDAKRLQLNVTTSGGSHVSMTTGTVNATVTGTVYTDNKLAIYQVDKVLVPLDLVLPAKAPAPAPVSKGDSAKPDDRSKSSSAKDDDDENNDLPAEASGAGYSNVDGMWLALVFGMVLLAGEAML